MTVPSLLAKAWAYLKRDFRIASSYQLNFLLTTFNSLFTLAMLYFIGGMVSPASRGLENYGGNYFAFVLVGFSFYQYFQLALTEISGKVHQEQMSGSLETVLGTKTPPDQAIFLSSLYGLVSSLSQLLILLLLGSWVFGVNLGNANLLSVVVSFSLTVGLFLGFGMISASFIIVYKKGDPFGWVIMTLNFVFGGAFFPLEQMPGWMRSLADWVPATFALQALRDSLLRGASLLDLALPLGVLGGLACTVLPLGFFLLRKGVRRAKKDGTMVLY